MLGTRRLPAPSRQDLACNKAWRWRSASKQRRLAARPACQALVEGAGQAALFSSTVALASVAVANVMYWLLPSRSNVPLAAHACCRNVVAHVRSRYPRSLLFAAGWSLGANIMTRYLGGWAGRL